MCIVFLEYSPDGSGTYQLIVAVNRDEFYDRNTLPAHFWPHPASHIIAGKDGVNGGSWLGFSKRGRFAVLTNYRKDFNAPEFQGISRGTLVLNYLLGETTPTNYSSTLMSNFSQYDGFNLITGSLGNNKEMVYCSNRGNEGACPLVGGVYGLSNSLLDSPWMKVKEGKKKFKEIISSNLNKDDLVSELLSLLGDDTCYHPDPEMHDTSHPEFLMKAFSSIFVKAPGVRYGTRTNTVILVDHEGTVTYVERTMAEPIKQEQVEWITTTETFKIEEHSSFL